MKYFLMILFSFPVYADLEHCFLSGETYGAQKTIATKVPKTCYPIIEEKSDDLQKRKVNELEVFGLRNLLLLKRISENKARYELIAGPNTKIENILAVEIDPTEKRVYVLNQGTEGNQILSYFYENGGNNAPARKLITNELSEAFDFTLDSNKKILVVVSKLGGWIRTFHLHADPDGKKSENHVGKLGEYTNQNIDWDKIQNISIENEKINLQLEDRRFIFNLTSSGQIFFEKLLE